MKITKSILLMLCIASFTACDELDELTEFDITEDFNATYNVVIEESAEGPQTFSDTTTIDIASNDIIQENLDAIEDVTLNTLTYEVENFTGAEGTTVTEASINFQGTTIAIEDLDLMQSDINNTVYEIADAALLNFIANTLQNNAQITATLTGTINNTPASFDIIINLDVTVTVDPI